MTGCLGIEGVLIDPFDVGEAFTGFIDVERTTTASLVSWWLGWDSKPITASEYDDGGLRLR